MAAALHLIVARWKEGIAWTDEIDGWNILIVQKECDLPNEGREASSYFWAFDHLYDRLEPDDTICCVQGNPFDHDSIFPESLRPASEFRGMGDWNCKSDLTGLPHHEKLPIARYALEWFGVTPSPPLSFRAGAQFLVPASTILSYPRSFHRGMVDAISEADRGAWVMERLWQWWLGGDFARLDSQYEQLERSA